MRKPRYVLLIGALAALGAMPVALATAAPPGPPTVATAAASSVSASGATLNGSVNPGGQQTSYAFQWGPTSGYGHETTLASAGAGTAALSESAALTGLDAGTTYHFRIIAINASGTSVGSDQTWTTSGTALTPSPPPVASTGSASGVGQDAATVAGTVTPAGQTTTYYFEYGPTANYGFETAAQNGGAGTTPEQVTAAITQLASSTTYHYRLVSVSAGGTALGADQTFKTTTPPVISTGGASSVRTTSAVLNGVVNPEGQATTYYFQYGTSGSYGAETPPSGAGSGTANVYVHFRVTDLTSNTTYHYRLVAQSAGGVSYGADKTVTIGQPGSQVAFIGRMGFVSPGRVIGVEAGCFGGTTRCTGHVSISHNGRMLAQRDFNIRPNSGGFQNMEISEVGERMLRSYNRVYHLLPVTVSITTSNGQKISEVMHLARWVWR